MGMFQQMRRRASGCSPTKNRSSVTSHLGVMALLVGLVVMMGACAPGNTVLDGTVIPIQENAENQSADIQEPETTAGPAVKTQPVEAEPMSAAPVSEAGPPHVLTLWHGFQDEDLLLLNALLEAYRLHNPAASFELVYVPYDDLKGRYIQATENGTGPHLLLGAGEWGSELYDLEAISDVSDLIPDTLIDQVNPVALAAVSYQDGLTSLPYEMSGIVMYRNRTLLPNPPATFRDLVTRAGVISKGGVLGAYLERGPLYAFPQMAACGGSLYDANGYPGFNNQSGQCWIGLLRAFETAGPVSFNGNDDLERFASGQVGIIFDGTWNMERLSEALGDQFTIDPWPVNGEHHLSGYVWTEDLFLSSSLDDAGQQAALSLYEFLLSPTTQGIMAHQERIPAVASLAVDHPRMAQAIVALSLGTPYPSLPEIEFYWEPMHQALVTIFEQGGDVSLALQTAAEQIIQATRDFKNLEED